MRYFFSFFLFIILYTASAQSSRGIDFEASDWEAVLIKAKQENKVIFLDAYTTWCTPCKEMDRNVFTSRRLGDFYNAKFVSVKMNMEEGFGPALAIRYGVNIFPSSLYITGDGTMVYKKTGFQNINHMVSNGHIALDPNKQMRAWENRYNEGDRHADFISNYFIAKYNQGDGGHIPLINEYFLSQKDWSTHRNTSLLFEFVEDAQDPKFHYILDHLDHFSQTLGPHIVSEKIEIFANQRLYMDVPPPSLEEAESLMTRIDPDNGRLKFSNYRIKRHFENKEYSQYADATIEHMKEFPTNDPKVLNQQAISFYQYIADRDQLNKALTWAKKSSDIEPNLNHLNTVASLYYKLRKKRKAKKYAKKAIKAAKKSGSDYSKTIELMNKIKSI